MVILDMSPSFKTWTPDEMSFESPVSLNNVGNNRGSGRRSCQSPHYYDGNEFNPRSSISSSVHLAAVVIQKVYKGYQTRRSMADCAVVVQKLWHKNISIEQPDVAVTDFDEPKTPSSRWVRAARRVAKVGKGLLKDSNARKLAFRHWLEAIDPRHRYGHNLHLYYDVWFNGESSQSFFYWLDVGEGKEVVVEKCSRNILQSQCVKYLIPKEREAYQVIAKNGRLLYKKTGVPLNTVDGSKWIFVLSTTRNLYVGQKKKGKFQHSSFLSGGATSSAGRLVVKDGFLKAIWPYSGHYHPTEENFNEFIGFLQENGLDLTNVKKYSTDDDETILDHSSTTNITKASSSCSKLVDHLDMAIDMYNSNPSKLSQVEKFKFSPRLSPRSSWSSGIGPRISCVRDYPTELQFKALEQVNLSPRCFTNDTTTANKALTPSCQRRSPCMTRLSSTIAYSNEISISKVSLTLPLNMKNKT